MSGATWDAGTPCGARESQAAVGAPGSWAELNRQVVPLSQRFHLLTRRYRRAAGLASLLLCCFAKGSYVAS